MDQREQDYEHDAFISYRRSDGTAIAAWLRRRLQDYKLPPKLAEGRKKLRIYQDTAYERATEDFWANNIEPALKASRYLVVVATPDALKLRIAGSYEGSCQNWVEREIELFLSLPQGRHILVVRAKGEFPGELPRNLAQQFPNVTIVDMRAFSPLFDRPFDRFYVRSPLREHLLTILGTLHGIESADIPELRRESERNARATRVRLGIIAATLFVLISGLGITALIQRNHARANLAEAQRQAAIALSRQLAAESEVLGSEGGDLEAAALLAAESMERGWLPENDRAIREVTRLLPRWVWSLKLNAPVASVAFSPDGRYVAAGSVYGAAYVFEALSGKEVSRLSEGEALSTVPGALQPFIEMPPKIPASRPGGAGVNALVFSPDGQYVAMASDDGTARVFQAASGKPVSQLTEQGQVSSATFSPDGRYVATGSGDGTARVFEATSGREVSRLTEQGAINAVAFSPDGRFVATGSADGTARLFNAVGGKEVFRLSVGGVIPAVAFSPDGKYIMTGGAGSLGNVSGMTNTQNHETVIVHEAKTDGGIISIEYDPKGLPLSINSGAKYNAGRVFEIATRSEVHRFPHSAPVYKIAFSQDGRHIATGGWDGAVRVFDTSNNQEISRLTDRGTISALAFSPNGSYLAVASWSKPALIFEAATGKVVSQLSQKGGADSLAFSPDGQHLITGDSDGVLRAFKVASDDGRSITGKGPISAAVLSANGRYAALVRVGSSSQVFDTSNANVLFEFTPDQLVQAISVSPDGRYLGVGSAGKTLRILEIATGKEISRLTQFLPVNAIAFSSDGRYVAIGEAGPDTIGMKPPLEDAATAKDHAKHQEWVFAQIEKTKTARLFEAASGKELPLSAQVYTIWALSFSSDGRYLATGSYDGTARVFEVATGRELWNFWFSVPVAKGRTGDPVKALVFSADVSHLAVATEKSVWTAELEKGTASRLTEQKGVDALTFSADGRYLATESIDKTARLFEVASGKEVWQTTLNDKVMALRFETSPPLLMALTVDENQNAEVTRQLLRSQDLLNATCSRLTRNLAIDEWSQYVGVGIPYHKTCPNLP